MTRQQCHGSRILRWHSGRVLIPWTDRLARDSKQASTLEWHGIKVQHYSVWGLLWYALIMMQLQQYKAQWCLSLRAVWASIEGYQTNLVCVYNIYIYIQLQYDYMVSISLKCCSKSSGNSHKAKNDGKCGKWGVLRSHVWGSQQYCRADLRTVTLCRCFERPSYTTCFESRHLMMFQMTLSFQRAVSRRERSAPALKHLNSTSSD